MSEIVLKRIETEGGEKKSKASFGTGQRAAEKVGEMGSGGAPFTNSPTLVNKL